MLGDDSQAGSCADPSSPACPSPLPEPALDARKTIALLLAQELAKALCAEVEVVYVYVEVDGLSMTFECDLKKGIVPNTDPEISMTDNRPGHSEFRSENPTDNPSIHLSPTEQAIMAAISTDPEEPPRIARKAGKVCNSHFRNCLTALKASGLVDQQRRWLVQSEAGIVEPEFLNHQKTTFSEHP